MRASKLGLAFLWLSSSSSGIGLASASGKKSGSTDQEENSNCHLHEEGMCSHCHDPCDTGDVFFQWNCIALEANVMDHNGPEASGDQLSLTQGPPASARALAMIHTAMFDAYNVVAGGGHYETYLPNLRDTISGAGRGASIDAAVATAAHQVLMKLYADDSSIIAMIDGALERTLDGIRSVPYKEKGIDVGHQVAEACMEARKTDGYDPEDPYLMSYPYNASGNPGDHDVDPTNPSQGFFNPGAGYMIPFGMDAIAEFRALIPPGLVETQDGFAFNASDTEYVSALMEVMEKGIFRGGEEAEDPFPDNDPGYDIANFWSYNGSPCTGTPPRLYNMIARDIAKQMRNSLDDNALLFTMLNVGLGNAGIASWESKYHYRLWRPIMGIRSMEGGEDWLPLGASRSNPYPGEQNFSPPFPAYTSGHATFGAVAFKTLINFYQTADIPFSFVSDEWNGLTKDQFNRTRPVKSRTFPTLTVAMAENAASRVYNGVHWRFDGTAGVEAGCRISDYIFTKMFLPFPLNGNNGRPRRIAMPDGDFVGAIDCILGNPSYQDSGDCAN